VEIARCASGNSIAPAIAPGIAALVMRAARDGDEVDEELLCFEGMREAFRFAADRDGYVDVRYKCWAPWKLLTGKASVVGGDTL